MSTIDKIILLLKKEPDTYTDYLKGEIIETITNVSDEKIVKYIHTMLSAAIAAEKQQADF